MSDIFDDHTIGLSDPGVEVHKVSSTYEQPDNTDYYDIEQQAGWIPRYIKVDADCTLRVDIAGHSDTERQKKQEIWCQKGYNAERICRIYKGVSTAGINIYAFR